MKAKVYLNVFCSDTENQDEALLGSSLLSLVNEEAELNDYQCGHVAGAIRNISALLSRITNKTECFVATDDFRTKMAIFVNSCR